MASVRVDLLDAKQGRLPPICICCGNPAHQMVHHTFYYQPTWLVICNLILPAIVRWCLASNSVVIPVPVCAGHAWRLNLPTLLGYILAAVLLLLVPVLLILSVSQSYSGLAVVGLIAVLLILVMLPAILVTQLITPRAYDITDLFLGLTAVSDQFAAASRRGGGLLTGGYEAGQSSYAQPQPSYSASGSSYGYAAQPARSGSWKLALIIGGSVLAVVLLTVSLIVAVAISLGPMARGGPTASLPQPEEPGEFSKAQFSKAPSAAEQGNSPPAIPAGIPQTALPPPDFGSSFVPPGPTASQRAKASEPATSSAVPSAVESSAAEDRSSASPRASSAKSGRPRGGRGTSSSGSSTPPENERPEPPIHAMDLRTRKVIFPPDHVAVPATFALQPGQSVWARQREGAFWHAGYVAEIDGNQVTVRYKGWSDFFNETLSRDMLCIDKALLAGQAKTTAGSGSTSGEGGKLRTWTDVTGRFKVEAELVKVENGQVTLRRANGDRTTLPLEKLSPADQEFVRENASSR
jgi:hypothetical protein